MVFIIISAFLTGCSALLYQVIFLRDFLTLYYGNELCIGSVLALWLLGTSIGGVIGAKATGYFRKNRKKLLVVLFFLVHLLFPILLFLLRTRLDIFVKSKGEYLPVYYLAVQCILFMFPLNFIIGFMFPVFCACAKKTVNNGFAVGLIYLSQSAGALFGGIVFTFVLIDRVDYFQIALVLLVLSVIIITLNFSKRNSLWRIGLVLLILTSYVFFFKGMAGVAKYTVIKRWDVFFSPLPLAESIDTRFQNVAIGTQGEQIDIYTNLKYQFSLPDPYSNEIFAQVILCQSLDPENILLVGGAYSGIVDACLAHNPDKIDIVEIDEDYIREIEKFLSAESKKAINNRKISLYFTDARFFIKNRKQLYDVIFINTPDPDTAMLNRFYTADFFRELKRVMPDNGICAFKARSVPNYIGDEIARYNRTIYSTLRNNFEDVIVVPGEDKIFIACKNRNVLSADPQVLVNRYKERADKREIFSPQIFFPIFEPERMKFCEKTLSENMGDTRINTDNNPIAYYINLYLWDNISGSKLRPFLKFVEKIRPVHTVFILAILMSVFFIVQFIKPFSLKQNYFFKIILYWIIFSTGFTGMGIELFLLFMFQNIFGYLYSMIGLIVALFMFGLVTGSLAAMLCVNKAKSVSSIMKILIISEISIPLLSFSLPFFMTTLTSANNTLFIHCIFTFLVVLCGFLTGIEFPLAVHLLSKLNDDIGFSSGILSNADHLGAFFGSLVVGTFFIPILGTVNTVFIIGCLNLSSFILIVTSPVSLKWLKK